MNWKCFLFGHKIVSQKAKHEKKIKVPIQAELGTGEEVYFAVSADKYTDYLLNRCTRCGKWWIDTYVKGSI